MKAQELRIGNFVKYGILTEEIIIPNYTGQVSAIEFPFSGKILIGFDPHTPMIETSLTHCVGIDLTPEIFQKFGFIMTSETRAVNRRDTPPNAKCSIELNKVEKGWHVFCGYPVFIKHLHQLQNLFYCMTGEELPTNLIY